MIKVFQASKHSASRQNVRKKAAPTSSNKQTAENAKCLLELHHKKTVVNYHKYEFIK